MGTGQIDPFASTFFYKSPPDPLAPSIYPAPVAWKTADVAHDCLADSAPFSSAPSSKPLSAGNLSSTGSRAKRKLGASQKAPDASARVVKVAKTLPLSRKRKESSEASPLLLPPTDRAAPSPSSLVETLIAHLSQAHGARAPDHPGVNALAKQLEELQLSLLDFEQTKTIADLLLGSHLFPLSRGARGNYILPSSGLRIFQHLLTNPQLTLEQQDDLYEMLLAFQEVGGGTVLAESNKRIAEPLRRVLARRPQRLRPDGTPSPYTKEYALRLIGEILKTPRRSTQDRFARLCLQADFSAVPDSKLEALMNLLFENHLYKKPENRAYPIYLKADPACAFLDATLSGARPERVKKIFDQISPLMDRVREEHKEALKKKCAELATLSGVLLPQELKPEFLAPGTSLWVVKAVPQRPSSPPRRSTRIAQSFLASSPIPNPPSRGPLVETLIHCLSQSPETRRQGNLGVCYLAKLLAELQLDLLDFEQKKTIVDLLLGSHWLPIDKEMRGKYISPMLGLPILKHVLSKDSHLKPLERVHLYKMILGFKEIAGEIILEKPDRSIAGSLEELLPTGAQLSRLGDPFNSHARRYAFRLIGEILKTPKRSFQITFGDLCKRVDFATVPDSELEKLVDLLFKNHLYNKNESRRHKNYPIYLKANPACAFLRAALSRAHPKRVKTVFKQISLLMDKVQQEYKRLLQTECAQLAKLSGVPLPKELKL